MTRIAIHRLIAVVAGALVLGGVVVLAVGFMEIRAEAVERGIVVDFSSVPTAIADPGSPILQRLAVACICALAVALVWPTRTTATVRLWVVAAVLAGCSMWVLLTTSFPYSAIDAATGITAPLRPAVPPTDPPASPIGGWFRAGALSPAVHVLVVTLPIVAWLGRGSRPSSRQAAISPDSA